MEKELGKIIRDSVHGDIFIENKYMKIVNTKEFQRLRRINQLSVGNYIFPSAQHTRFSHSIGTFYLMEKIIKHIEVQLNNINILISEKDKELALLIALLHDVGHGPFSHAFEGISSKDHEEWTKEIILGDTQIHREIINNFGQEYPEQLVKIIDKNKEDNNCEEGELNLFFVIKSLISSQLDADRLDYLVRDAKNTGVVFGDIDLSRIIHSIRITEVNDEICVCIPQKNVLDIKNYLLARDNMHESVYFHPSKCELEEVIKLIFKRCSELLEINTSFEINIPEHLKSLIKKEDIALEDYIYLDDYVVISFFKSLLRVNDYTLNKLCNSIINREKFTQIQILNNTEEDISKFKSQLKNIVGNNLKLSEKKINEDYYWIEINVEHTPYKSNKEEVYVLVNDGTIKTLESVTEGIEHKNRKNYIFINLDILLNLIEEDKKEIVKINIEKLINIYNNRNHIEIERKFLFEDIDISEIESLIKSYNKNIKIKRKNKLTQIDVYYDTENNYFYSNDITCRVREKNNKLYATVKNPTKKNNSNERFEHEFEVDNYEKNTVANVMKEYVSNEVYNEILDSNKVLEINNNRVVLEVVENSVKYEVAYDSVVYNDINGNEVFKDNELEIELKSNYYHRVHLKKLTDYLLKNTSKLIKNTESKYKRGMKHIIR